MDRSFEQRRRELEAECEVPDELVSSACDGLEEFMKPFVASFRRHEQASHATTFVQGLCSDLECKNGESIAYHFGLERKRIQNFIGESAWDDAPLRNELACQVANELGEPDGVLALDPSTFPKSGKQSVGVSRQWCGRLGKVENCQIGVYLSYVSSQGHALVDFELYLPKEWIADKQRMRRAGVPKDRQRSYRSRQQLCLDLLDRCASKLPHAWITADDEFGRPAYFRRALRERNERYLLAVPCNTKIRDLRSVEHDDQPARSQRADEWAAQRAPEEWTTIMVRDGEKGPITVQAIMTPVETGWKKYGTLTDEVFVVIRYQDRDSKVLKTDYYLSNAEAETPLKESAAPPKPNIVLKNVSGAARAKRAWRTMKFAIGSVGIITRSCRCWPLGSSPSKLGGRKKKTPAITFPQVRIGIASILRRELECDSPRAVKWRTEKRLIRNQLARLYHWKRHNKLPPKNLERMRI